MEGPTPADIQYQKDHINDTNAPAVLTACIICFTLAVIAVSLRVLSRRMAAASLGKDDYMIFVALLFTLGYVLANFISIHYGDMKHAIAIQHPIEVAKLILIIECFYAPAICCVKLSCLLLYHRLFPSPRFRIILWGIGAFIVSYSAVLVFSTIFVCRPIRGAWDPAVAGRAQCLNINLEYIIGAVFNVITDVATLILPLPQLWTLNLPRTQKLQLIGIFLSGGFVCVISIYRVPHMKLARNDASYADANADIWSIVEVGVGIVSACLPTMRPIVTHFTRKIKTPKASPNSSTDQQVEWPRAARRVPMRSSLQDLELGTVEVPNQLYSETQEGSPASPAPAKVGMRPFEQIRRGWSKSNYFRVQGPTGGT